MKSSLSAQPNRLEQGCQSLMIHHSLQQAQEIAIKHLELNPSFRSTSQEHPLLEEILNSLPGIFYVFDSSGVYLRWNKAMETASGYSAEEIRRMTPLDFFTEVDREMISRQIAEVFSKGETEVEANFLTKDGSKIPYFFTGRRVMLQGQQVVVGMGIDISERKELQTQLFRSQRLESIGTLAGGIAHDLNNVLLPLCMGAELLRTRVSDPESLQLLSTMEGSARRGADLVQQLLTFARGRGGSEIQEVNAKFLLQELVGLLQQTFPKNINIRLKLPDDPWLVRCNPTQIHQVLMNLCVNGRDAMPAGGDLTIEAANTVVQDVCSGANPGSSPGPHLLITVSDTGCGMPPEVLDNIFDPFFTTKPLGQGSGLGLSTTLGIVREHRGLLNVYSQPGRGTRFQIYLPASTQTEASRELSEPWARSRGNGGLILIVDDELPVREMMRLALEAQGYKVLTASNGPEAILMTAQNLEQLRAAIVDMSMPILDGPATIRAIKRIKPTIKVLPVSGVLEQGRAQELTELKVSAFLKKPYSAEKLIRTVGSLISSGEATR